MGKTGKQANRAACVHRAGLVANNTARKHSKAGVRRPPQTVRARPLVRGEDGPWPGVSGVRTKEPQEFRWRATVSRGWDCAKTKR